jgi:hypothetical protein
MAAVDGLLHQGNRRLFVFGITQVVPPMPRADIRTSKGIAPVVLEDAVLACRFLSMPLRMLVASPTFLAKVAASPW